jgi:hypothetical protein
VGRAADLLFSIDSENSWSKRYACAFYSTKIHYLLRREEKKNERAVSNARVGVNGMPCVLLHKNSLSIEQVGIPARAKGKGSHGKHSEGSAVL